MSLCQQILHVRVIDGRELHPAPHPVPHFIVQNGLLYCVTQRRGEEKTLLVVPKSKTETVMELAHSHPMAGHLGAQKTAQRIRDRFHWPGLDADVKRFCQACPTCQRTTTQMPPPSLLIPLPIIEVPFERIGMDLVRPLPRSVRGREHILVIVDYATRFNQTLKQMLRQVTTEDRRDWDRMLPYVLFGVREVPQASTSFTPFELLFGRQPRGLLDMAREAWEQQPAPPPHYSGAHEGDA
ncbi:hypothetical protein QQF64_022167 [Cirrhinus molitorella]|uniref:Gypsy retrotransposon integrase-like protein 1 n=1 Tax=Cirrhinus molitorella TaxID=172907 RepID=A0ABR3LAX3_9TELE